jgi:hypothetical protein
MNAVDDWFESGPILVSCDYGCAAKSLEGTWSKN